MWTYNYTDELHHHGIKGMKWGVRRFRKKDGSLTPAGKKRYQSSEGGKVKQYINKKYDIRRTRLTNSYRKSGMNDEEAKAAAEKRVASALDKHEDQEWAKTTVAKYLNGRKGSTMARAGKYMERNANMKVSEALKKAEKVDASIASAKLGAVTAAIYAPSIATSYAINQAKINRYVAKHPNTKLTDAEILKLVT